MNKVKKTLIKKAGSKGVYEDFGQKEVKKLEDKYSEYQYKKDGVWDEIRKFDSWCMDYTG